MKITSKTIFNTQLSTKARRTIVDLIVSLYVLLFLYTAASKLFDYSKTELRMSKSPIITEFAPVLAWMIPIIEIIISILLLIPKTILTGLYASVALMVTFTAYIFFILNYSSYIPCSCGGIIASLTWNEHLLVNILFIFLAIIGVVLKIEPETKKS
jgi:uncharacterized membrane protein YphA (DoxX/SURF4 family)